MPKGNVLVVVGELEAQQSISHALVSRGYGVSLATSEEAGLSAARLTPFDAIILDADLQNCAGIETCSRLRTLLVTPIILVSSHAGEADIVLGLGIGADAYLPKPIDMPVLIAYVDAAVRRETTYRQRQGKARPLKVSDLTVDLSGCELRRNGTTIPLSPTEFRLIRTLAEHAGRVLTRDQLLDTVWDMRADDVYSRTVDVHIGRLRRKIEDDPTRPQYIVTVTGVGYKLRDGEL